MIGQRCPKCRSSRIRLGYTKPALLLRLVGIHHLLCDNCNLLFTGFAVPGTVGTRTRKPKPRRSQAEDGNGTRSNGRD